MLSSGSSSPTRRSCSPTAISTPQRRPRRMDSELAKPRLQTGPGRPQPRRCRPIRPHMPPNSSVDTRAAIAAGKTKMKINSKDFRVREGDKVNLEKWPTKVEPVYKSKEQYKNLLEEHVARLAALQQLHWA